METSNVPTLMNCPNCGYSSFLLYRPDAAEVDASASVRPETRVSTELKGVRSASEDYCGKISNCKPLD